MLDIGHKGRTLAALLVGSAFGQAVAGERDGAIPIAWEHFQLDSARVAALDNFCNSTAKSLVPNDHLPLRVEVLNWYDLDGFVSKHAQIPEKYLPYLKDIANSVDGRAAELSGDDDSNCQILFLAIPKVDASKHPIKSQGQQENMNDDLGEHRAERVAAFCNSINPGTVFASPEVIVGPRPNDPTARGVELIELAIFSEKIVQQVPAQQAADARHVEMEPALTLGIFGGGEGAVIGDQHFLGPVAGATLGIYDLRLTYAANSFGQSPTSRLEVGWQANDWFQLCAAGTLREHLVEPGTTYRTHAQGPELGMRFTKEFTPFHTNLVALAFQAGVFGGRYHLKAMHEDGLSGRNVWSDSYEWGGSAMVSAGLNFTLIEKEKK